MRSKFLLIAIFFVGLFLRTWHYPDWFHFEMDEEVVAWKTQKFWRDGQPFLIGGGTPFGVHLGPAFYYLSAIPLVFTRGDPIGWIFLTSFVSLSTLYLMFLVGKTLYGEGVGLVAAALWAFSFSTVTLDRHWWPFAMDPLLTLLTMLSLFHIMKGHARWWIVLGLTLAFAWQADLTNLVLFLAAGVIAIKTFKKQRKHIAAALGVIAFSFLPLVVFEFRHPGANLGTFNLLRSDLVSARSDLLKPAFDLVRFIPSVFSSMNVPNSRSSNLADWYTWCKDVAASRISFSPIMMLIATGFLLIPVFRWFRKKRTADFVVTVLLASGIFGIGVFRFFGGDLFDFYLAPLYPIFLIVIAVFIIFVVKRKYLILSVVSVLFLINLPGVLKVQHRQGLSTKQQAIAWVVEQVGDRPFALESLSRCHRYNGIRYLFMLQGNEPVASFMDSTLSWLYDEPPATTHPDLFVVFVTPDDLTEKDRSRYNELKRRTISSKQFGDFDVVIADNHDQRFQVDLFEPERPQSRRPESITTFGSENRKINFWSGPGTSD